MKQGGCYAKKSAGFTIAETMIVLAVSGGLFLIAAVYIGGKQARTEFQVGVRDIQTQLQQIITQTESGYYGLRATSSCSTNNGVELDLKISGSAALGTSGECVFIGKALVVDSTKLYVYPLVGARQVGGLDTTNPVTARATVAGEPTTYILPNGIKLVSSSYDGGAGVAGVRGFALLSSMGNVAGSAIGSQTFSLRGLRGPFAEGDVFAVAINKEKNPPTNIAYLPKNSVGLCMQSGGTHQSALITIGGTSGLAIRTVIKSGLAC